MALDDLYMDFSLCPLPHETEVALEKYMALTFALRCPSQLTCPLAEDDEKQRRRVFVGRRDWWSYQRRPEDWPSYHRRPKDWENGLYKGTLPWPCRVSQTGAAVAAPSGDSLMERQMAQKILEGLLMEGQF
eukprot:gnl/TRDRNA2_/TRDRNA2_97630_c0_seq1.p1 gnl/TRDRNA2_/TRDRNA2_97630_c0~~gnl/TRDRNA2_/TRDRNA2_97630_c0_seq1.p1  ORF type:complete len:148 (-),score=17.20 gnl/TRDRNA2_/TRDRNA2_97630_c0_seq1:103-495(-)